MSNFYYPGQHHTSHMNQHSSHNHHGGRSRRAPRLSASGHPHKQVRNVRTPKEQPELPTITAFRREFEAAKSFDTEDDDMFCPFHLLTEDDLSSIHSGSDRSSLSSGSPQTSPVQPQAQPTPTFLLSSSASPYNSGPAYHHSTAQTKLHQPMAQRTRNAIPIVDPTTRAVASPPPSVSPARQMTGFHARRW